MRAIAQREQVSDDRGNRVVVASVCGHSGSWVYAWEEGGMSTMRQLRLNGACLLRDLAGRQWGKAKFHLQGFLRALS